MSLAPAWLALIISHFTAAAATPSVGATLPLAPKVVLQRYAVAVVKLKEPRVMTFDYTLEQTGSRTVSQTHRVFRSGSDERDETLTVDGKRLSPPKVRIFRGRRNRYTIGLLAPRVADYTFILGGTVKDGHHIDYFFRLKPKGKRAFGVTDVTIDGVRFLPLAIGFKTTVHDGAGSVAFGSNARWWVPYNAMARATVAADIATERLSFYTYRFPATLPPSVFTQARRLGVPPALRPLPVPVSPAATAVPLEPAGAGSGPGL